MTRAAFERDLLQLKEGVVRMGERAGEAIHGAVEALRARDVAAAERIIAEDDAIDALHMDLEQRCMRLLATQQPMAGDLRTIASVFAITIDLERMADHAEGMPIWPGKPPPRMTRSTVCETACCMTCWRS